MQRLSEGCELALAIPTLTGHGESLRPSCFTAILLYYILLFLGFALVPLSLGGDLSCVCPFLVSDPEVQSPWTCISACSKSESSGHTLRPQGHSFRSFTFPPFQLVLPLSFSRALLHGNKEPELPSVPVKPGMAETGGSCPPVSNKSSQAIILISL